MTPEMMQTKIFAMRDELDEKNALRMKLRDRVTELETRIAKTIAAEFETVCLNTIKMGGSHDGPKTKKK